MDAEGKKAMEYIDSVAQESGNRRAFYHGMVFGLGQAAGFMRERPAEAMGYIDALLEHLDESFFKAEQQ